MITTAGVFIIGNILLIYVFALALLKFDATTVASISVPTLTMWNGIGAYLTGPQAQAKSVAANIDDPAIKTVILPEVSKLRGLDPLQANNQADAAILKLANDDTIKKILPPKN